MRCEHCNEREATTHIKKIINGNKTELHLCSECAAELGVAERIPPLQIGRASCRERV